MISVEKKPEDDLQLHKSGYQIEVVLSDYITSDCLTKHYGKVLAVDSVSLKVRKGEIYGFLGLNGAGKTTTIRMLLGMIRPTSGKAYICGQEVNAGNYRLWTGIGYLVEMPFSYPNLTVKENLEIIRRLRNLPDKKCVDRTMDALRLTQYSDCKACNLSLGNSQRLPWVYAYFPA